MKMNVNVSYHEMRSLFVPGILFYFLFDIFYILGTILCCNSRLVGIYDVYESICPILFTFSTVLVSNATDIH